MAFVVLVLVAAALGLYGYTRGAVRFGLALLPLLFASLLMWLLGPAFYRIDGLRNAGLLWPGLILLVAGLSGGYVLQSACRKKAPKELRRGDRIGGLAVGLLASLFVVWLGCVYFVVWSASNRPERAAGSAEWLAGALNTTVIRWIPGLGAGSDAMMSMVEIATAEEAARRQAIEDLGLSHLVDLPQVQAILGDAETQADIRAAASGSVTALWRLQKNPHVLRLLEADEFTEAIAARSLGDLANAVRKASKGSAAADQPDH